MEIDKHHRTVFAETGILNLKQLIAKSKIAPAKEFLLGELKRLRLRENGKWQTKKFEGISPFQIAGKIAQGLQHHPYFDEMIPKELVVFINNLAGCELRPAQAHPQILITPPQKEAWSIPELGWHVDIAVPSKDVIPGIQVFVLLDNIAPRGGGTMAISGSHRFRNALPTSENVVEMSGSAGDLYLMDMRVRHAPSINSTKNARMMLTCRYLSSQI